MSINFVINMALLNYCATVSSFYNKRVCYFHLHENNNEDAYICILLATRIIFSFMKIVEQLYFYQNLNW